MSFIVSIPPTMEPVNSSQFKDFHININDSETEDNLDMLATAVRQHLEKQWHIAFVEQTIQESFCNWNSTMKLSVYKFLSLEKIEYYDENEILQTLATTAYDITQGDTWTEVHLRSSVTTPNTFDKPNTIIITYKAGYQTPALVPRPMALQIIRSVAKMYFDKMNLTEATKDLGMIWPYLRKLP